MDIIITKSNKYYHDEEKRSQVYHHYSFAEYYNPNKMNMGPLRVFSEYTLQTDMSDLGYGWQSHRDIEIITLVLDGELEYKNNKGNHETITAGDVFVLSAGTGIVSSTRINPGTRPVKVLEVWVYPSKYSLKPSWARHNYAMETSTDKFLPIVVSEKSVNKDSGLEVNQDVNFYIARLSSRKELEYELEAGRGIYLFIISGKILLNGNSRLCSRDSANILCSSKECISIANDDTLSDLMLIDLPRV